MKNVSTYLLEAEILLRVHVFYRRLGAAATGVDATGPGDTVGGGPLAGGSRWQPSPASKNLTRSSASYSSEAVPPRMNTVSRPPFG